MAKHGHWQVLWETWDLRAVILLSLFLQTFLIFSAPLRKRMSTAKIMLPVWFAYLLADLSANFAVGLIIKNQGTCKIFDPSAKTSGASESSESPGTCNGPFGYPPLLAFWAPFLLVHLGGPDTITAFAIEDNELWLRHFLGLGFQCWATTYAFFRSFMNDDSFVVNELWLPTVLMFIAGIIKYTERTRALYLASTRKFKDSFLTEPDPGPDYAKMMDDYTANIRAKVPTKIEMTREPSRASCRIVNKDNIKPLQDLEVVLRAHKYFSNFKGLIADLFFSFRERNQSRDFFLERTPKDAFNVVQIELNFFYEILYTKATVVQTMGGYLLRFLSFSLNCAAIALFYYRTTKMEFKKIDIGITYTLLLGAIALDLVATAMVLYSDWTAVALAKDENPGCVTEILKKLLNVERDRWPKPDENPTKPDENTALPDGNTAQPDENIRKKPNVERRRWHEEDTENHKWFSFIKGLKIMQTVRRRWTESLSQFNLIKYCLDPRAEWWEKTIGLFGLTNMLDGMRYVEPKDFNDGLRVLIYEEMRMKSELADDLETAREIFSARGDWILRFESCTELIRWINEVDFEESIIMWHIATELCYNTPEEDVELPNHGSTNAPNSVGYDPKDPRELSKLLSDYMLYLLVIQGTMLSLVEGIGQIRFRDTCAEAKKFFRGRKIGRSEEGGNCCRNIFSFCKCFCEKGQQQSRCTQCFSKCSSKGENGPDEVLIQACKSILNVNTAVEPVAVKGDKSKSVLFDACMLAKELMKYERNKMWDIVSKVWVELLFYAASHCRSYTHAAQLSKGGQLLTLVWLLMAHLGLGNQFQMWGGHALATIIVGDQVGTLSINDV